MINNKYPNISPSLNLDFTNSNTIDPRITFSRASAATYYDGKTVAKAEENLLKYSQEFDSVNWVKPYDTVLANAVSAPDGTMTADTLTAAAVNNYHTVEHLTTAVSANTQMAVSVYAKAGAYGLASINIEAGMYGWVAATFDLSAGTVTKTGAGTAGTYIASSISSVGGGWYRLSLTGQTTTSISKVKIALASSATPTYANYANDVWTPAGTETIHLWGAQLEQRSQATAYTPTTTQPITNYIPVLQTAPANVPRIDHDPVTGECKGLLIEEQRTNLVTYSEQLDNSSWGKADAAVAANSFVAPDGSLTADVVTVMASGGYIAKTAVVGATSGQTYSISIFTNTLDRKLTFGGATPNHLNASYSSTPIGNGWYRHTGTVTLNADGYVQLILARGSASAGTSFAAWGAQTELGSFATSYIKTEASQVTRAADSAQMTGANFSSWYRQDEGTFFANASTVVDVTAASSAASGRIDTIGLSDGSVANMVAIGPNAVGLNNVLTFYSAVDNTAQCNVSQSLAGAKSYRFAAAFALNNFALSVSGAAPSLDTSGNITGKVDRLFIGNRLFSSQTQQQNGHIKRITYYPKRLTDAQLQALTA